MNTIPNHIVRHIPEAGPIPSRALNEMHEEIQSDLIALYQHKDKATKELSAVWQCLFPGEDVERQRQIDMANANLTHVRAGNTSKFTQMVYLSHLAEYGFVSDAGFEPFIDSAHHEITLPVITTYPRLVNLDHRHIIAVDVDDVLQTDYATLANNASYLVDGNNSHVFVALPTRAYDDETANYVDLQITVEADEIANPFNTLQIHTLSPLRITSLEVGSASYAALMDEQDNPLVTTGGNAVFADTSIFHLKEYVDMRRLRLTLRQYRFIPVFSEGKLLKVFPFIISDLSLLYRQYVTRTDSNPIAHILFKIPLHQENIDITSPSISDVRRPDISSPGIAPYIFTLQADAEDRSQTPAPFGNASSVSQVFVRCDLSFSTNDPSYEYRPVLKGVRVDYDTT